MKYLMQILLGLILLQLLQSCDYSKSRDVLWMKKIGAPDKPCGGLCRC